MASLKKRIHSNCQSFINNTQFFVFSFCVDPNVITEKHKDQAIQWKLVLRCFIQTLSKVSQQIGNAIVWMFNWEWKHTHTRSAQSLMIHGEDFFSLIVQLQFQEFEVFCKNEEPWLSFCKLPLSLAGRFVEIDFTVQVALKLSSVVNLHAWPFISLEQLFVWGPAWVNNLTATHHATHHQNEPIPFFCTKTQRPDGICLKLISFGQLLQFSGLLQATNGFQKLHVFIGTGHHSIKTTHESQFS